MIGFCASTMARLAHQFCEQRNKSTDAGRITVDDRAHLDDFTVDQLHSLVFTKTPASIIWWYSAALKRRGVN